MTYLVVHFLACHRNVDFLLENVALLVQLNCPAPVIECSCDKHLFRIVRPGVGMRGTRVSDPWQSIRLGWTGHCGEEAS